MTQREVLEAAMAVMGDPEPDDDVLGVAITEVIRTTLTLKQWEAEEGDESECECEQCVAAVSLAHAVLEVLKEEEHDRVPEPER